MYRQRQNFLPFMVPEMWCTMDGQIDEQTDGRIDGRMDGRMDRESEQLMT